jgi:hypothetical protein
MSIYLATTTQNRPLETDNHRFNPAPNLSISLASTVPTPAAALSLSTVSTSLILTASSAALTLIPHFSYMVVVSPGWRVGAALGMNIAANLGLPAERMRAKNGSHPIGDFRVLDHSSSSFQSLLETSARSLCLSRSIG